MRLLDQLNQDSQTNASLFARTLAREDYERLRTLCALAAQIEDADVFAKRALMSGWTSGDLRTHELKETLCPLVTALHAAVRRNGEEQIEEDLETAWRAFCAQRFKVLLHCL